MSASYLESIVLRANPAYRLVPSDRLPRDLRQPEPPQDFFGMLLPRQAAPSVPLSPFPVSQELALLLFTLRVPSKLPFHVRRYANKKTLSALSALILDGVLEIKTDNGFVSGVRATQTLRELGASSRTARSESDLQTCSMRALRYGQELFAIDGGASLGEDPVASVAARLYSYNTVAAGAKWRRLLANQASVARFLTCSELVAGQSETPPGWRFTASDPQGWWHYWQNTAKGGQPFAFADGHSSSRPRDCKLYISPAVEDLPETFAKSAQVLMDSPATAFKVGSTLNGLVRPDKFVAYFSDWSEMKSTADRLTRELGNVRPHGVPFTADLTGNGLLSWGVDPPAIEQDETHSTGTGSWRSWVSQRLAEALYMAVKGEAGAQEPWMFALERASLDGIDTATWTPTDLEWNSFNLNSAVSTGNSTFH